MSWCVKFLCSALGYCFVIMMVAIWSAPCAYSMYPMRVEVAIYLNNDHDWGMLSQEESQNRSVFAQTSQNKFDDIPDKSKIGVVTRSMILAVHNGVDIVVVSASLVRDLFGQKEISRYIKKNKKKCEKNKKNGVEIADYELLLHVQEILRQINKTVVLLQTEDAEFAIFVQKNYQNVLSGDLRPVLPEQISSCFEKRFSQVPVQNLLSIFRGASERRGVAEGKKVVSIMGHGQVIKAFESEYQCIKQKLFATQASEIAGVSCNDMAYLLSGLGDLGAQCIHIASCYAGGCNLLSMQEQMSIIKTCKAIVAISCLTDCHIFAKYTMQTNGGKTFFNLLKHLSFKKLVTQWGKQDAEQKKLFAKALAVPVASDLLRYRVLWLPFVMLPDNKTQHERQGDLGTFTLLNIYSDAVKIIRVGYDSDISITKEHIVLLFTCVYNGILKIDSADVHIGLIVPGPSYCYIRAIEANTITLKELLNCFAINKDFVPAKLFFIEEVVCKSKVEKSGCSGVLNISNLVVYKNATIQKWKQGIRACYVYKKLQEYGLGHVGFDKPETEKLLCGPKQYVKKLIAFATPYEQVLRELSAQCAKGTKQNAFLGKEITKNCIKQKDSVGYEITEKFSQKVNKKLQLFDLL